MASSLTRRGISPQLAAITEIRPTPMVKAPRPPIASSSTGRLERRSWAIMRSAVVASMIPTSCQRCTGRSRRTLPPREMVPDGVAKDREELIPHGIRLATRVSTALEHASARIAGDDSVQAGAFPPIRIRLDFVPALAQRLEHVCGDSPLRTHQARVVGRWKARVREAIAIEARRFHGFLRIEAKLDKIQKDLQRPLGNVITSVTTEGDHGLTVLQGQGWRRSQARTLARGQRCWMARFNFRLRATQTQGHARARDNGARLGTLTRRTGKDVAVLVHHPKVRRASRLLS